MSRVIAGVWIGTEMGSPASDYRSQKADRSGCRPMCQGRPISSRGDFSFFSIYSGAMTSAVVEPLTVLPPEAPGGLAALLEALKADNAAVCDGAGEQVLIPPQVKEAFYNVALAMSQGRGIQLVPHQMRLTTQEAADILNISRPTLVKLLEEGRIPYEKPGRHRRISLDALLAYQESTRSRRRAALREAAQGSADEVSALLAD